MEVSWGKLLDAALTEPGKISKAYTAFHNYSLGNQLLVLSQMEERGIPVGPVATYKSWQAKGRQVSKGQKALWMCQPVTRKKEDEATGDKKVWTMFTFKPGWFAVSQTEGELMPEVPAPAEWDLDYALTALDIKRIPFTFLNGNAQGYAVDRSISINPVAVDPLGTSLHEIAHVLLGHTELGEGTPKAIRELEAEGVALIVTAALGHTTRQVFSAGYLQHWNDRTGGQGISERSAQKIFATADKILKAGRVAEVASSEEAA